LGDALVDLVQEPRVADLIAHRLAGPLTGPLAIDRCGLHRLLRALPGGPGLSFQEVDLLEFGFAGLVEIPNPRLAPQLAELFQVGGDCRLTDVEMLGDLGLRPVLQVEVRDLLAAAIEDVEVLVGLRRHDRTSCLLAAHHAHVRDVGR
jgi:hypothetical protein